MGSLQFPPSALGFPTFRLPWSWRPQTKRFEFTPGVSRILFARVPSSTSEAFRGGLLDSVKKGLYLADRWEGIDDGDCFLVNPGVRVLHQPNPKLRYHSFVGVVSPVP